MMPNTWHSCWSPAASGKVRAYYPGDLAILSCAFVGEGTYSNSSDVMKVSAVLNPVTARLRFKGDAGKSVKVTGLMYCYSFNTSHYLYGRATGPISLTIGSDGFTPYVYVQLGSGNKTLTIIYDDHTYSKTFSTDLFQPGKSGFIDLETKTLGSEEGWYNGHEYVDLGLPSGIKWATCNIGASSPEDYGDYFAWGETEPYYIEGHSQDDSCSSWKAGKTAGYDWASYKWCSAFLNRITITKYSTSSVYGTIDNKTILDLEDDASYLNWGGIGVCQQKKNKLNSVLNVFGHGEHGME